MLEQRRLDYLQAMGITQWMPRKPLANAPEPRWWPSEAANADSLESAETIAVTMPPIASIPEAIAPAPTAVTDTPVAPITPQMQVEKQPVPEFQLHFLACHLPIVWVTSDPQELVSLQRFVFALQRAVLGKAHHLYEPIEFKWPYLQSTAEDQSQAVAMQALKAQWQVFQNEKPTQAITFGDQATHWLEQAELTVFKQYQSLSHLLQDADLKRQLWLSMLTIIE